MTLSRLVCADQIVLVLPFLNLLLKILCLSWFSPLVIYFIKKHVRNYRTNNGDIATNPPYKLAQEFVEHALSLVDAGRYVCMFLKVLFLESRSRKELFKQYPPKLIYVSSSRINCAKNGDFNTYTSSAIAYAWFVWQKGYTGESIVRWIN